MAGNVRVIGWLKSVKKMGHPAFGAKPLAEHSFFDPPAPTQLPTR
jgi:hypothetical protein